MNLLQPIHFRRFPKIWAKLLFSYGCSSYEVVSKSPIFHAAFRRNTGAAIPAEEQESGVSFEPGGSGMAMDFDSSRVQLTKDFAHVMVELSRFSISVVPLSSQLAMAAMGSASSRR